MGLLNWLFGRKETPAAAPAPKPQPMRISDEVIANARLLRIKGPGVKPAVTVFTAPKLPPGVGPKDKNSGNGIAMDEAVTQVQSWANQQSIASFWSEGLTFLGYPYLAELAQRPEYRTICETIATEMTRKWIKFTAKEGKDKQKKIDQLEAEFKRLNVAALFDRATQLDGFFGRGHIYIDTGDTDNPAELQLSIGDGWDKLSQAKISPAKPIIALRTVEPIWTYPTSYDSNDPLKDNWYRPDQWWVQAKIVHSSRLITFIGREVPDLLKPTYSFGGLSLSQMAKPYVDNWLSTRQGVNEIITNFNVFVLLTNLGQALQADGDQLFKRAELFAAFKNNQNLMMLNKEDEDFKNIAVPLSGLDQLQAQAQEHMCAVAHTPTVKLLGLQPAGLNADSDGVMRAYYDYVGSYQEHLFRDKIKRLMGLVMLSLWGKLDEDIDFQFEPLYTLDEKGMAEVQKTKAETGQILMDAGAISQEEERTRLASDDGSDYQSIDPDDLPDLMLEEEEGFMPRGGKQFQAGGLGEGGEKGDKGQKKPQPQKEAA